MMARLAVVALLVAGAAVQALHVHTAPALDAFKVAAEELAKSGKGQRELRETIPELDALAAARLDTLRSLATRRDVSRAEVFAAARASMPQAARTVGIARSLQKRGLAEEIFSGTADIDVLMGVPRVLTGSLSGGRRLAAGDHPSLLPLTPGSTPEQVVAAAEAAAAVDAADDALKRAKAVHEIWATLNDGRRFTLHRSGGLAPESVNHNHDGMGTTSTTTASTGGTGGVSASGTAQMNAAVSVGSATPSATTVPGDAAVDPHSLHMLAGHSMPLHGMIMDGVFYPAPAAADCEPVETMRIEGNAAAAADGATSNTVTEVPAAPGTVFCSIGSLKGYFPSQEAAEASAWEESVEAHALYRQSLGLPVTAPAPPINGDASLAAGTGEGATGGSARRAALRGSDPLAAAGTPDERKAAATRRLQYLQFSTSQTSGVRTIISVRVKYGGQADTAAADEADFVMNTKLFVKRHAERSFGSMKWSASIVTGYVYELTSIPESSVNADSAEDIRVAAVEAVKNAPEPYRYDVDAAQHFVIFCPSTSVFSWGGLGSTPGKWVWMNGAFGDAGNANIAYHEVGHNFGLLHASTVPRGVASAKVEYGDRTDVMGSSYDSVGGDFSAAYKHVLNWFDNTYVAGLAPSPSAANALVTSGTFLLAASDRDNGEATWVPPGNNSVLAIKAASPSRDYISAAADLALYLTYRSNNVNQGGSTGVFMAETPNYATNYWATVGNTVAYCAGDPECARQRALQQWDANVYDPAGYRLLVEVLGKERVIFPEVSPVLQGKALGPSGPAPPGAIVGRAAPTNKTNQDTAVVVRLAYLDERGMHGKAFQGCGARGCAAPPPSPSFACGTGASPQAVPFSLSDTSPTAVYRITVSTASVLTLTTCPSNAASTAPAPSFITAISVYLGGPFPYAAAYYGGDIGSTSNGAVVANNTGGPGWIARTCGKVAMYADPGVTYTVVVGAPGALKGTVVGTGNMTFACRPRHTAAGSSDTSASAAVVSPSFYPSLVTTSCSTSMNSQIWAFDGLVSGSPTYRGVVNGGPAWVAYNDCWGSWQIAIGSTPQEASSACSSFCTSLGGVKGDPSTMSGAAGVCPPGSYLNRANTVAIPNTATDGMASGAMSGLWSKAGGNGMLHVCTPCAATFTSPAGSTAASACVCPLGTTLSGSVCVASTTPSSPSGAGVVSLACKPNEFISDGACVACPRWSYSAGGGATECSFRSYARFRLLSGSAWDAYFAGTYTALPGVMRSGYPAYKNEKDWVVQYNGAVWYYMASGLDSGMVYGSVTTKAPVHSIATSIAFCDGPGDVAFFNGTRICFCVDGTGFNPATGTCEACPMNTFRPALSPTLPATPDTCTPCGNTGRTNSTGSRSCPLPVCVGTLGANGLCSLCGLGYFGQNGNCTVCPVGMTSTASGAATAADCVCAPGFAATGNPASPCAPCSEGAFKGAPGNTACAPCPAGQAPTDDRTACGCPKGYAATGPGGLCGDIDECRTGNGGCDGGCANTLGGVRCSCPLGWALGRDGKQCLPCPLGTISIASNSSAPSGAGGSNSSALSGSCEACPGFTAPSADGRACVCPPGYLQEGNDAATCRPPSLVSFRGSNGLQGTLELLRVQTVPACAAPSATCFEFTDGALAGYQKSAALALALQPVAATAPSAPTPLRYVPISPADAAPPRVLTWASVVVPPANRSAPGAAGLPTEMPGCSFAVPSPVYRRVARVGAGPQEPNTQPLYLLFAPLSLSAAAGGAAVGSIISGYPLDTAAPALLNLTALPALPAPGRWVLLPSLPPLFALANLTASSAGTAARIAGAPLAANTTAAGAFYGFAPHSQHTLPLTVIATPSPAAPNATRPASTNWALYRGDLRSLGAVNTTLLPVPPAATSAVAPVLAAASTPAVFEASPLSVALRGLVAQGDQLALFPVFASGAPPCSALASLNPFATGVVDASMTARLAIPYVPAGVASAVPGASGDAIGFKLCLVQGWAVGAPTSPAARVAPLEVAFNTTLEPAVLPLLRPAPALATSSPASVTPGGSAALAIMLGALAAGDRLGLAYDCANVTRGAPGVLGVPSTASAGATVSMTLSVPAAVPGAAGCALFLCAFREGWPLAAGAAGVPIGSLASATSFSLTRSAVIAAQYCLADLPVGRDAGSAPADGAGVTNARVVLASPAPVPREYLGNGTAGGPVTTPSSTATRSAVPTRSAAPTLTSTSSRSATATASAALATRTATMTMSATATATASFGSGRGALDAAALTYCGTIGPALTTNITHTLTSVFTLPEGVNYTGAGRVTEQPVPGSNVTQRVVTEMQAVTYAEPAVRLVPAWHRLNPWRRDFIAARHAWCAGYPPSAPVPNPCNMSRVITIGNGSALAGGAAQRVWVWAGWYDRDSLVNGAPSAAELLQPIAPACISTPWLNLADDTGIARRALGGAQDGAASAHRTGGRGGRVLAELDEGAAAEGGVTAGRAPARDLALSPVLPSSNSTSSARPTRTAARSANATRSATGTVSSAQSRSTTRSPSATVSSARSASSSRSPSATGTSARTITSSRSGTPSARMTRSSTGTASVTASRTSTRTSTSSATPVRTRSTTPSASGTASSKRSVTSTRSGSVTRSATPSASLSRSAVSTRTPVRTTSMTPTTTGTLRSTWSPSATRSPLGSRTAVVSMNSTRTSKPSVTGTGSISASRTNAPSRNATGTALPSRSSSLSARPTLSSRPTNTSTGSVSATRSPFPTRSANRTVSSTGSVSASFTSVPSRNSTRTSTKSLTPSRSVSASGTSVPSRNATRSAIATASSTRTPLPTLSARPSNSSTGSISATRSPFPTRSANRSVTSSGSVSASFTSVPSRNSTLSSTRTLSSAGSVSASNTAAPTRNATKSAITTASSTGTPLPTPSARPSNSSTGSISSTRSPFPTRSANRTLSASGSVSASLTSAPTRNETFTAIRTASVTRLSFPTPSARPSNSSTGSNSATRSPLPTSTATRSATSTATATGTTSQRGCGPGLTWEPDFRACRAVAIADCAGSLAACGEGLYELGCAPPRSIAVNRDGQFRCLDRAATGNSTIPVNFL